MLKIEKFGINNNNIELDRKEGNECSSRKITAAFKNSKNSTTLNTLNHPLKSMKLSFLVHTTLYIESEYFV